MNTSDTKEHSRRNASRFDGPDAPNSVGWTSPRHLTITDESHPFVLENGSTLPVVDVEYETYGELNAEKDNVILICHALSGDAHVAGWDIQARHDPRRKWRETHPGWWDSVIGPGKPIDTERFYVICANVLGSCYGTTGPESVNPATGTPYGLDFPMVTVGDWVNMEKGLLDKLGIAHLYAIIGGSLGGQQTLEWAMRYPDMMGKSIIMASGPRLSAQGLGFNAVGRHAIMHDTNFNHGDYYDKAAKPDTGLAVARMLAHITYLSGKGMDFKFGRRRVGDSDNAKSHFGMEFDVEGYLNHQSENFVKRFDANSYLYITRAMDYYDAADAWCDPQFKAMLATGTDEEERYRLMLANACKRIKSELMVVSFSSDWLYPPDECEKFVNAFLTTSRPLTYVQIQSDSGHDAFLVDTEPVGRLLRSYLRAAGINRRFKTIKK